MPKAIIMIVVLAALAAGLALAEPTRSCRACGQAIHGAVFETLGDYYHPEHFACEHCREPITGAYMTYRSKNYHNQCFRDHIALRCKLCRGIVEGQYILDYWGNAYHQHHQSEAANCDFCHRFVTDELFEGGVRFSDGRFLCRLCHASAVKKLSEARTIMVDVARRLGRYGIEVNHREIHLHIVGLKKMQILSGKRTHGLRGFTDYKEERNLFRRVTNRKIDVYILYGMPRTELIGTLAHELTHVWQFKRGRLDHDKAFSEGSCNYASYLILKEMKNEKEAQFMISVFENDEDPVYGGGFRRVRNYVSSNGIAKWLKLLSQKRSRLP